MVRPRSSLSVFSAVVLVKVSVVWFCCKASFLAARHSRFSPIMPLAIHGKFCLANNLSCIVYASQIDWYLQHLKCMQLKTKFKYCTITAPKVYKTNIYLVITSLHLRTNAAVWIWSSEDVWREHKVLKEKNEDHQVENGIAFKKPDWHAWW